MKKIMIVQGPEGSGKSMLAIALAKMHGGAYEVITEADSRNRFWLSSMKHGVKTFIIEEAGSETIMMMKPFSVRDLVRVKIRRENSVNMPTPNIILVTKHTSFMPASLRNFERRFVVFDPTSHVNPL